MKISIWGINYSPELTGIAPFNRSLAEFMAERGHQVNVITGFPYYPEWRKRIEDVGRIYRDEYESGVAVNRCWLFVPRRVRAWKRILHEATFVASSFLRSLTLSRPDIYVVVSPPLALGFAAWLLSRIRSVPYVFHVQDLQPDAAIGLGMLQDGVFTKILYWLEAFAYRYAAKVSGISGGMMTEFHRKGVSAKKRIYFPNGIKLPVSLPKPGGFRGRYGIQKSEFLVAYSGNMGVKQGLEVVLEAAQRIAIKRDGRRAVRFVLVGSGARRERLGERVKELGLKNVLLLNLLPEDEYLELMADLDCSLITQQENAGAFFFPSKLLMALAIGRPVITVADEESELAKACAAGKFGVNVLPNAPMELAAAIESVARNGSECVPEPLSAVLAIAIGGAPRDEHGVSGRDSTEVDPMSVGCRASNVAMGRAGLEFVQQFELRKVLGAFEAELSRIVHGT